MGHTPHPTPPPDKQRLVRAAREAAIDRQVADSFPASDPPSYSGGRHGVGAPAKPEAESKEKK